MLSLSSKDVGGGALDASLLFPFVVVIFYFKELRMLIAKKHWMQIHTYLSLFFLPAMLIYAITGIGYIFGFKDDAGATVQKFTIPTPETGKEQEVILQFLRDNGLEVPSNTTLRNTRRGMQMGSLNYSVSLQKEGAISQLTIMDRSLYGILVLMHKAKGAFYFDIIAVGFGISLMLFYLSGLIFTSFCKKNRSTALIVCAAGFVCCSLAVFVSV